MSLNNWNFNTNIKYMSSIFNKIIEHMDSLSVKTIHYKGLIRIGNLIWNRYSVKLTTN